MNSYMPAWILAGLIIIIEIIGFFVLKRENENLERNLEEIRNLWDIFGNENKK